MTGQEATIAAELLACPDHRREPREDWAEVAELHGFAPPSGAILEPLNDLIDD